MNNINYVAAELDILDSGMKIRFLDGKWHMTGDDVSYYDAPTKKDLIEAYFNHDMSDYCNSITIREFVELHLITSAFILINTWQQRGYLTEAERLDLSKGRVDIKLAMSTIDNNNCYFEQGMNKDNGYLY